MLLTVTGASTLWTLLSSTRISMALRHRAFTSDSLSGSHFFSCSICLSRSDIFLALSSGSPELAAEDGSSSRRRVLQLNESVRGTQLFYCITLKSEHFLGFLPYYYYFRFSIFDGVLLSSIFYLFYYSIYCIYFKL